MGRLEYLAKERKRWAERKVKRNAVRNEEGKLLKYECFLAYGNVCCHCDEHDVNTLCMDHVKNNGYEEPNGGCGLYARLKKMAYPKNDYQLLCASCNHAKEANGGVLPLSRKKLSANELFERIGVGGI